MSGRSEQRREDLKVRVEHVPDADGQGRLTKAYQLILRAAVRARDQSSNVEKSCEEFRTKKGPMEQE